MQKSMLDPTFLYNFDADIKKDNIQPNDQLHSPSKYSPKREEILKLYKEKGYEAVDQYFHKTCKKDIVKYTISGMMPKGLKRAVKKVIGRVKQ